MKIGIRHFRELLKLCEGSSTVAIVTTATLLAPLLGSLGLDGALASLIQDRLLYAIAHGQSDIDWAGLAQVSADNAGLNLASDRIDTYNLKNRKMHRSPKKN